MTQLAFQFIVDDEQEVVSIIRERSRDRVAIASIATELGLPRSHALELARRAGVTYKHRHPASQQVAAAVRAVVREGLSIRDAARAAGISRTAVNRYVLKRRQSAANKVGGIEFSRQENHCDIHGRVHVWPCVACAAIAAKAAVAK